MVAEGFSKDADALVKIMGWLHGGQFKKELMLRCYRRCPRRVSVDVVEAVLHQMDIEGQKAGQVRGE